MPEIMLSTQALCRDFAVGEQTVHALRDVTLTIPRGQLTVLRGRSGSGKTTLINLLGALDLPTAGTVFCQDQDITAWPEEQRDEFRRLSMGFVFQSVALIGLLSARENVEFGLRLAGFPEQDRAARAEQVLRMVGLGNRMDHRPHELSGGEQQRVAIARAMAHKPAVLFADEPTAELDSHMGLRIVRLFRELCSTEGITVVMTTHDPAMMELADCVYTLQDGQVTESIQNPPRQDLPLVFDDAPPEPNDTPAKNMPLIARLRGWLAKRKGGAPRG